MMRIAWFSPLDSSPKATDSAAAYTSRLLLPELERSFEIELFDDASSQWRGRPVYPYLTAWDRHRERPFDAFVYHIENGRQAYFSRVHAAVMPGVCWFHDFLMTDFGPEPILNSGWQRTVASFRSFDSSNGTQPAAQWWSHDEKHKPKGPHAFREAAMAAIKIFSGERDHREYRRVVAESVVDPADRSYLLPLPVETVSASPVVPEGVPIVAFCGSPRIEDRAHDLLDAVSRIGSAVMLRWLIAPEEEAAAREMLAEFGVEAVELRLGRTPEAWTSVLDGAFVAVHTLFSVFGRVAPMLNISACRGVPIVVTNFGSGELMPSPLVFKVSCGSSSSAEIYGVMRTLLDSDCGDLRRKTAEFGVEHFDSRVVAGEFASILRLNAPKLRDFYRRWNRFEYAARRQTVIEARDLLGPPIAPQTVFEDAFRELGWIGGES